MVGGGDATPAGVAGDTWLGQGLELRLEIGLGLGSGLGLGPGLGLGVAGGTIGGGDTIPARCTWRDALAERARSSAPRPAILVPTILGVAAAAGGGGVWLGVRLARLGAHHSSAAACTPPCLLASLPG